jgi:TRAP-type uncharacterized transport system substrate-binding protein
MRKRWQLAKNVRRELWLWLGVPILLVLLALALGLRWLQPAPPKRVVVAVPDSEGGARHYAKKYATILARDGISLEVRQSLGTPDSIGKLERDEVDLAFGLSTNATPADDARAVSLGSLSYVPLWVFYRGAAIDDLKPLAGRQLALGRSGSSTRSLALELLRAAGGAPAPSTLHDLDREASIAALAAGKVDAVFLVAPAESPAIRKLAALPDVSLLSLGRGEAYARRFPHLHRLTLPRGALDLAADLPPHDATLLAPTAVLMARDDLHPAIETLLLKAAREVHGGAGLLDHDHEFPTPMAAGLPIAPAAARFYETGGGLLQRYLPFWAAAWVDRAWLMVVPLLAVVLPIVRLLPPIYRWRVRSRVYRWYGKLKALELRAARERDVVVLQAILDELDELEQAVQELAVPLAYADQLYVFREHVDFLQRRVLRAIRQPPPTETARTEPTTVAKG